MLHDNDPRLDLHFLATRQGIGFLGLILPVVLYGYGQSAEGRMQPSISEFYYTAMGDVFVGCLAAIGVFLITYRGYRARPARFPLGDRATSIIAGIAALGVAFLPAGPDGRVARCIAGGATGPCAGTLPDPTLLTGLHFITGPLHFACAAVFFLALAYFCLVLFPMGGARRTDGHPALSLEHLTYYACGAVLIASILGALAYLILPFKDQMRAVNYIFWVETAGVLAFAIAWLTKGNALKRPLGFRLTGDAP
jgi:hypothetical protein